MDTQLTDREIIVWKQNVLVDIGNDEIAECELYLTEFEIEDVYINNPEHFTEEEINEIEEELIRIGAEIKHPKL